MCARRASQGRYIYSSSPFSWWVDVVYLFIFFVLSHISGFYFIVWFSCFSVSGVYWTSRHPTTTTTRTVLLLSFSFDCDFNFFHSVLSGLDGSRAISLRMDHFHVSAYRFQLWMPLKDETHSRSFLFFRQTLSTTMTVMKAEQRCTFLTCIKSSSYFSLCRRREIPANKKHSAENVD